MSDGYALPRRRLIQMAAAAPALSLTPWLSRLAAAEGGSVGGTVGRGTMIPGDGLVGVSLSWHGADHGVVATVRALVDGEWGEPIEVEADHGHGPADPTGRNHSPALIVPGATAYDISPRSSVVGGAGDLRHHPIPASERTLDFSAVELTTVEPIPGLVIIERSNWTDVGRLDTVDCQLRSSVFGLGCRADVGLRHALVHHTVNPNGYTESQTASIIKGIQNFHVGTRGWDDIAYNFVIDRFGRIWHARDGDIDEPIGGGHTTGLNAESVGVAVLGTFTSVAPDQRVIDSLGLLLGWKLSLHGIDPLGHTPVRSTGGDYAERGEMVDVRNIAGHRDHQQTSCPGDRIYVVLPEVRTAAAELVPVYGHLEPAYSLDDVTVDGWAMDRFDQQAAVEVDIVVDGEDPLTITADAEVPGLADNYPDAGAMHGFNQVVAIDIETTSIVVNARARDGRTAKLMDLKLFATFIDVEPHRFFAPGVWFLREKGLTTGTLPGLFEPMDRVTRGQMATFLHRFMDSPEPAREAPFTDLTPDGFYLTAVHWLHESGITTGTAPDTFAPYEFVTRGQMGAFLWRLCGEIAPASPSPFDDVAPGAFYADAVAWLAETGITTGLSPTTYGPDKFITRGEMATFLQRLATTPEAWTVVEPPSPVEISDPVEI